MITSVILDKSKIHNKLRDYRRRDNLLMLNYPVENEGLKTIKISECIDLIHKLDNDKCIGCNDSMLFSSVFSDWRRFSKIRILDTSFSDSYVFCCSVSVLFILL